jgi:hypothetical protein
MMRGNVNIHSTQRRKNLTITKEIGHNLVENVFETIQNAKHK